MRNAEPASIVVHLGSPRLHYPANLELAGVFVLVHASCC